MSRPKLGVVIVTYNAAPTIAACLSSLRAAPVDRLQVMVVDNASTDDTVSVVSGLLDPHEQIRLLQNPINLGFAAGCNIGLAELEDDPDISHFWLLNPDCQVTLPSLSALFHFLEAGHGTGLTGGRVIYRGAEGLIQSDGGQIDWETGVTHLPPSCQVPPSCWEIRKHSRCTTAVTAHYGSPAGTGTSCCWAIDGERRGCMRPYPRTICSRPSAREETMRHG